MSRVITYVDGFNLYFGLKSKKWQKYYWLNLVRLANRLLKQGQQLEATHYFTAIVPEGGSNAAMRRQRNYLDALRTLDNLTLHLGHFLEKALNCRSCGNQWRSYEEKMTDVNIATQMLADAFDDGFDTALLLSADSDLTTPVRLILNRFPAKRIVIVQPPGRFSVNLCSAATAYFTLGESHIRHSQLPDIVMREDGYMLHRPDRWR